MTRRALRLGLFAFGLALTSAAPGAASDWRDLCAAPSNPQEVASCEGAVLSNMEDLDGVRRLAWVLLSNHREPRALELFGRLATLQSDDPEAQFDYAAALATVWNYEAATGPITLAIRLRGDEPRYYRLGAIIYEQLSRPDDAFVFHLRLARMGDRTAMYDVATDYAGGHGTAADPEAARRWFEAAAELDHVAAMEQLADAYRDGGLDLPRDAARAGYWQERAEAARSGP